MSRHQHESDCVVDALESMNDRLDEHIELMKRLVAFFDRAEEVALAQHLDAEHSQPTPAKKMS